MKLVKLRSQFCKSWLLTLVVFLKIVGECVQLMGLVGNYLALRDNGCVRMYAQ